MQRSPVFPLPQRPGGDFWVGIKGKPLLSDRAKAETSTLWWGNLRHQKVTSNSMVFTPSIIDGGPPGRGNFGVSGDLFRP
ncbi:MAG: hypothetical protein CM15mP89_4650 [Gammaproteobacteria bacterium]|nr:MAG: hypothetical protein CM15mP89_4650 [Gammaproteobacteria bacterium]